LSHPWSLAFLPNGDMLVTERDGRLRRIHNGTLQRRPIADTPSVHASGQEGLLDVALHPRFADNQLLYLTSSKDGERGTTIVFFAFSHLRTTRTSGTSDCNRCRT
jgi:glucose/arabinose dehydrogenase